MLSVVIPVYRNEESLPELLAALNDLAREIRDSHGQMLEVVFVVDGSPDNSFTLLLEKLPAVRFASKLLLHSRNFGSFAAIRTGLMAASGEYLGVMAADLQEPPELMARFLEHLMTHECDVVVGCRESREDPPFARFVSNVFWRFYKALIFPDLPEKGVDIFGCNSRFRDHLVQLEEANSSLVGQIFWLGFRRREVLYNRRARKYGKSAWSLGKKVNYLLDSIFSFTDLPVRLLSIFGLTGILGAIVLGLIVLLARVFGDIAVPGYAATILTIVFFGGINALGLGIVGTYVWRSFENTKRRPLALVMDSHAFNGTVLHRVDPEITT